MHILFHNGYIFFLVQNFQLINLSKCCSQVKCTGSVHTVLPISQEIWVFSPAESTSHLLHHLKGSASGCNFPHPKWAFKICPISRIFQWFFFGGGKGRSGRNIRIALHRRQEITLVVGYPRATQMPCNLYFLVHGSKCKMLLYPLDSKRNQYFHRFMVDGALVCSLNITPTPQEVTLLFFFPTRNYETWVRVTGFPGSSQRYRAEVKIFTPSFKPLLNV